MKETIRALFSKLIVFSKTIHTMLAWLVISFLERLSSSFPHQARLPSSVSDVLSSACLRSPAEEQARPSLRLSFQSVIVSVIKGTKIESGG